MPWTIEDASHLATQDKASNAYNINLPYAGHDKAIIAVLRENGAVETVPVKEAPKEAKDGS